MPSYDDLDIFEQGDIIVVRVKVRHEDGGVLRSAGLLASAWAVDAIGSELDELADRPGCRKLIVDFVGVEDLSSLMLGLLVKLHKKLAGRKGQLVLCGLSPNLRKFFDETMLGQLFQIKETEADALAALA